MAPRDQVGLLRQAFPAERDAGMGTCAWCGRPRNRRNALCKGCWATVDGYQRAHYMAMDIFDRARWILDNRTPAMRAQVQHD